MECDTCDTHTSSRSLEWWDDVMSHILSTSCYYLLATCSVVDYSYLYYLVSRIQATCTEDYYDVLVLPQQYYSHVSMWIL